MIFKSWITRWPGLKDAEERYSNFQVEDEVSVSTFDLTKEKLEDNLKRMLCFIQKPQYLLPFLCPGRLVKVGIVYWMIIITIITIIAAVLAWILWITTSLLYYITIIIIISIIHISFSNQFGSLLLLLISTNWLLTG